MEQQQPDCFPTHLRNQTSFHRLFGHQAHRPASPPRRWIAANHGDDPFSFRRLQQRYRAGALLIVKSLIQTGLFVAAANLAHGLGSQRHEGGNFGGRLALIKLLQRQSAKHGAHGLDATAKHAVQLVTIRLLQTHLQVPISPHAPG